VKLIKIEIQKKALIFHSDRQTADNETFTNNNYMTYPHLATFSILACYWIITKYLSQGFRVETKGGSFL
jgi:hypothetical protein